MRHTASFLQTFHTGQTEAQRAEESEREALAFLAGGEDAAQIAAARTEVQRALYDGKPLAPMTAPKPVADRPALKAGQYVADFEGITVLLSSGYSLVSEKQAKWICGMLGWKDVAPAVRDSIVVRLGQGLARSAASAVIDTLRALPAKPKPVRVTAEMAEVIAPGASTAEIEASLAKPTEDGIYVDRATGRIFKLQFNRATGDGTNLYAKQLSIGFYRNGEWETQGANLLTLDFTGVETKANGKPVVEMSWDYKRGLIAEVKPEWRLTAENAKEWGVLYGSCVRCHRDLTKEESIGRMMGDTCAGKQGL